MNLKLTQLVELKLFYNAMNELRALILIPKATNLRVLVFSSQEVTSKMLKGFLKELIHLEELDIGKSSLVSLLMIQGLKVFRLLTFIYVGEPVTLGQNT
jgi:hypothetical protein